jgi:hypothetical protein
VIIGIRLWLIRSSSSVKQAIYLSCHGLLTSGTSYQGESIIFVIENSTSIISLSSRSLHYPFSSIIFGSTFHSPL